MTSSDPAANLREFIYLDPPRVRSLAAQLGQAPAVDDSAPDDATALERLFLAIEPAILARPSLLSIDKSFDFAGWTAEAMTDGRLVRATGVLRLLDYSFLSEALSGLPAVLRKMSKLEMEALRNSDEGRRMSKLQLQQRQNENQQAITKVEEFKMDELNGVVAKLYNDVVRIKLRPSPEAHPAAVLVGSADPGNFYDTPAAITQKYGIEIDAGWSVVGQINQPNLVAHAQPIPTGNKMEDAFEQVALLMNSAFRLANSPTFPNVSFTPLAIYRTVGG